MPRLPRYAAPGSLQHVVQRGNNRAAIFARLSDYQFFRECVRSACEHAGCSVHAYVFMTNHVHLLMTPHRASSVASAMQSIGRRYVRYFNDVHERTGTLWEGRYRATLIDSERYLFTCYRYVELNPVRAGIAGEPRGYAWSSHACNAYGSNDPVVTPHERYLALGDEPQERQCAYRALFALALHEPALDAIRDATNKGWVLGTRAFRDGVASRLGRPTQPVSAGRAMKRFNSTLTPKCDRMIQLDSDPESC